MHVNVALFEGEDSGQLKCVEPDLAGAGCWVTWTHDLIHFWSYRMQKVLYGPHGLISSLG